MTKKKLTGANTFSMKADMGALQALMSQLQEDVAQAVRPAAQAAAQVYRDHMLANVRALGKETGNLESAIYQKYSREHSRKGKRAQYNVSWNHKKAPHGHWLEYGWIQRYEVVLSGGRWKTLVRPSMRGKPKPGRHDSQAAKDAYYVPRKGGPKQHLGRAFARRAASSATQPAMQAAVDELHSRLGRKERTQR